jgi:uncharacterized membrane protein
MALYGWGNPVPRVPPDLPMSGRVSVAADAAEDRAVGHWTAVAAGPAARGRRAMGEFLLVPLVVTTCLGLVAVVAIWVDATSPAWLNVVSYLISPDAASDVLSSGAQAAVTATAITFATLMISVQQAGTALTPIVSDQFLHRRLNQVFFGFFCGVCAYSFLTLTFTKPQHAEFSAVLELVLAGAALGMLVLLIYGTVDQMRATTVVFGIHKLALAAARSHVLLMARCRTAPELTSGATLPVTSDAAGYIIRIDLTRLAKATSGATHDIEVELKAAMGSYLACGDEFAVVQGGSHDDRVRLRAAVRDAVVLDRVRDMRVDASYAVDQLANIIWSAGSSAQQKPEAARAGIQALRDLLNRWTRTVLPPARAVGGALPVVYRHRLLQSVLEALVGVLAVTAESHQHHTCSEVIQALAAVLPQLPRDEQDHTVDRLRQVLADTAAANILTSELKAALDKLGSALRSSGRDDLTEMVVAANRH